MNPYVIRFAALMVCASIKVAIAAGQPVPQRSVNWSPYRPAVTVDDRARVSPAQFVDCEPCPPGFSEVITDAELQEMRVPGAYQAPMATSGPVMMDPSGMGPVVYSGQQWQWELLPADVIWHSYWAGVKESRTSGVIFQELHGDVTTLDVALGGRATLVRYGTRVNGRPEGLELQLEGAGQPRLNLDEDWDLDAADFRFGVPLIYGEGRTQWKLSYYHLSSHLGDEFIERTGIDPADRVNYARDEIVVGFSFFPFPAWRWYAEAGWAFYANEGADPWEFQFGVDYAQPGPTGLVGTPFFAINGYLREEVDFGGLLSTQAGWLWRGQSGRIIRTGLHYLNGKSSQYEFNGRLEKFEHQIGAGLWYDF